MFSLPFIVNFVAKWVMNPVEGDGENYVQNHYRERKSGNDSTKGSKVYHRITPYSTIILYAS